MKQRHTDYAVYGNVIVLLLLVDSDSFIRAIDDSEAGRCRIVCLDRKCRRKG